MAVPRARMCASRTRRGNEVGFGEDGCGDEVGWIRGELMGRYFGVLEPPVCADVFVGRRRGEEGSERTPVLEAELDRGKLSKAER